MLALTKKVDYGLIALCHLANHRDEVATARVMAERYHLPPAMLMNVMKSVAQAGLVRSSRGARGGYELARRPEEITLNAVIEAIEGPVRFVQCVVIDGEAGPHQQCELSSTCPVSMPAHRLHAKLKHFLSEVTLADIASDPTFDHRPAMAEIGLALTGRGS